ncbi:galectin-4-like [Megalops cyprinoides]|uniref:galectin-4-like n=1 Tax=Megalops cyprinoides TaxID=118141 RepID=UPI0018655152|nr:galectin-4-like [Megalops cyprinoides]
MNFMPPPGYQPIYNPCIPYVGPICGGLRTGMSVYVQGRVPHEITRFHINLQCGEMEGCDIAFHFNPRFDFWDKVVFNTFQNGCWEGEEKIHEMPFSKGDTFELVIVVNSEGYQVNVNGRQFYLFQHRMPVERVCALQIGGDIIVETLNIIGGGGGGMGYPGGNLPMMGGEPIYNPCVPYSNMIPGGMMLKRTIIIRGMVPYGANRFAINFMASGSRDIAFHFNPRIMEGLVVRNCYMGGSWGEEDRELNFNPFQEGQYFDISVRCGSERFKVFVNGQHVCDFYHRFQPFTQIDMLEIEGDVQLSYIHF